MVRLKLSHVQESCSKLGFEFLDDKYRNSSFKHTFRCIRHDQVHKGCFIALKKGIGLRCCRLDRIKQWRDYRKHGIDQVKSACLEHGYELIDKEYLHINYKHHFKCLKHNQIHRASYKQIKRGAGLKCCHKKVKPSSEDYIIDKLNNLGFSLLSKFDGINEKSMLKCKKHGKVFFGTIKSIVRDHKKPGCCSVEEPIVQHESKANIENSSEWRHEVKEENEFTCFVCRKKNLTETDSIAHQLDQHQNVGICICSDCNVEFHKLYGYSNNTKEQFDEFVIQFKKDPGGPKAVLKKIEW